jgi:hypothetical protein
VAEYVAHYNTARPRRGIGLGVPTAASEPAPAGVEQIRRIERVDVLGGLSTSTATRPDAFVTTTPGFAAASKNGIQTAVGGPSCGVESWPANHVIAGSHPPGLHHAPAEPVRAHETDLMTISPLVKPSDETAPLKPAQTLPFENGPEDVSPRRSPMRRRGTGLSDRVRQWNDRG